MPTRAAFEVDEAKPDMTPMIDVVFLMIVFFVCIDFRVLEAKLPAYLPRELGRSTGAVEPQEVLDVHVHVRSAGAMSVDSAHVTPGRPNRFRFTDRRVAWQIGARRFDDLDAGTRELARIARDPAFLVVDATTGERRPIACAVDGMAGARYDEIAKLADACRAAGFTDIHFGGGRDSH